MTAGRQPDELRGALFMLAAAGIFSIGFAIVKYLTFELPQPVVVFWRCLFAALCFVPMAVRRGPRLFATARPFAHFWRAALGCTGFLLFVFALTLLPLGDAVALSFTGPLWAMVIGGPLFGDRITPRLIAAAAIGFGGVLLIAAPTGDAGFSVGTLLALASAVFSTLAGATVKRLTATEPPDRIAFYFMAFGSVVAFAYALFEWRMPAPQHWALLAATGLFFYLGQLCLTRSLYYGTFSRVSPLDFARLPLTVLAGYLAFGEIPSLAAIGGMILIVAAALDLTWTARRRDRGAG